LDKFLIFKLINKAGLLVIFLFYSFSVYAIDYTGVYEGAICKTIKDCNKIKSTKDILRYDSIIFTLKHNTNRKTVSVDFHDLNTSFSKMRINGNHFNGKIDFTGISGKFDDDEISIFYFSTLNDKKFYIKAFLNEDSNISTLLKDLRNENKNNDNKKIEKYEAQSVDTNQINVLDLRIYDLEKDIKNLTLQIEELLFLIDDLNNKIDNIDTNTSLDNDLKLLLTELEARLILLELNN